jgi:hypothetical protein
MFGLIPFPVKLVAGIAIVLGAAGWGYMKGSSQAEIALSNYKAGAEKQISDLKTENFRISNNVTTQYVDRVNTIKEKEIQYRDRIVDLGPQNNMSNGWVHLHDTAARLANPDMTLASDRSPSGVMDNSALAVVIGNYAICKQNAEQLSSLQKWINDNRAAVDAANARKGED